MPIVLIRTNADSITKVFGALASLENEMKAGAFTSALQTGVMIGWSGRATAIPSLCKLMSRRR